jgi:hypothetical protein
MKTKRITKRKGALTILSVTFILFLMINGLADQKKTHQKITENPSQLVLSRPDFCFSNVSHYNEIKCKDPIFVITFWLHNKGTADFLPNPQCELYLELIRAKDNEGIHWFYLPMNYKIEKSKFRRMKFTINYADIKKKDVLKSARKIKLQLYADVTHKLTELDETNNEYKTDNITHFCIQKSNVPLQKNTLIKTKRTNYHIPGINLQRTLLAYSFYPGSSSWRILSSSKVRSIKRIAMSEAGMIA